MDKEMYKKLAQEYYGAGHFGEALEVTEEAMAESPQAWGYLLRASIFLNKGDLRDAEKEISQALDLEPESLEGINLSASIKLFQGSNREAKDLIEKAIEREPKFWKSHYNLGRIYHKDKNRRAVHEYWIAFVQYPRLFTFAGLLASLHLFAREITACLIIAFMLLSGMRSIWSLPFAVIAFLGFSGITFANFYSKDQKGGVLALLLGSAALIMIIIVVFVI